MSTMIEQDVLDRLLLAKVFLEGVRFTPGSRPDSHTTAHDVLISHDAADLALAGIARHLSCLPKKDKIYLMDYVVELEQKVGSTILHHGHLRDLDVCRKNIKHHGQRPDIGQWHDVGRRTYRAISDLCEKYLDTPLDAIDESILIQHGEARSLLMKARDAYGRKEYRTVLELLAHGLFLVFRDNDNPGLRNMRVGDAGAEAAIKLTSFGVNANEFLAFQEFLPYVTESDDKVTFKWNQEKQGHPANWTEEAAVFCLQTFVHVAVRIQGAPWIPSAIPFFYVYEYKVTALEEGVEIVDEKREDILSPPTPFVVRKLAKGESIIGSVHQENGAGGLLGAFRAFGKPPRSEEKDFITFFGEGPDGIFGGKIDASKVRVTCVPRNSKWIQENYPDLPEIDWQRP